METIAVYFEPKVRTYGFNLKEKLVLYELTIAADALGVWGRELTCIANLPDTFHLVWACPGELKQIKFFLLCDDNSDGEMTRFITRQKELDIAQTVTCESFMDMLYFQGPHFGDRHGIADFTVTALSKAKICYRAMACSAATVYLVFSRGQGATAKKVLAEAFEIPRGEKREKEKNIDGSGVDT